MMADERILTETRPTIYVASKTRHAPMWRKLKSEGGYNIISTWIYEAGIGETSDWVDLWSRCIAEASSADFLIVYSEPGDILKGAWVEVGAALSNGKPVFGIGCEHFSVRNHPLFECISLPDALARLRVERNEK